MKNNLLLKNCKLLNDKNHLCNIFIEDEIIKSIYKITENSPEHIKEIDVEGNYIAPGFIDVHIQGAGGADVLYGTDEALDTMSNTLAQLGTIGYLATTIVNKNSNKHLIKANEYYNKKVKGAKLLGVHLEGPFINPKKKGGLSEKSILPPGYNFMKEILSITKDSLKMMTIAPELEGVDSIIKLLLLNNVIPSFAHSDANYEETKKGFVYGINHITHIFNAMNPINHRVPGPIPAIFENDTVTVQIISDGHHLNGAIVNLVYKNIGADRCICITDGMHGMGLPEGNYFYNGKEYESKGGAAKYLDGTLIGSTTPLGKIAYKFMQFTNCTPYEAINTITLNPAKLLKLDDKYGSIEPGKVADIVIIDKKFNVLKTFIRGEEFLK